MAPAKRGKSPCFEFFTQGRSLAEVSKILSNFWKTATYDETGSVTYQFNQVSRLQSETRQIAGISGNSHSATNTIWPAAKEMLQVTRGRFCSPRYFLLACQAANTSVSRSGFIPARIFNCLLVGCFLNQSSVALVVSASGRNVSPLLTALLIFIVE